EDGIRDFHVTGVQTCALPISASALMLGIVHGVGAQEYSIIESLFLPPEYYVGDPVELRLTLRSRYADSITLPKELPQPSWGAIQNHKSPAKGGQRQHT